MESSESDPGVLGSCSRRPIKIRHLRWWIAGALLASTMINYIDRQTLSVLAPYLKLEYGWRNEDFAWVLIAFRIAYGGGQSLSGPFLDSVGTRRGLATTVTGYSAAAALTSVATGLSSFAGFRFLLGLGESANFPGATKVVAEWFPKRERALAVAIFDSGSNIGAAITPWLVLLIYAYFGSWRPAFVFTGALGLIWAVMWRGLYHIPERHPYITDEERKMILEDRRAADRTHKRRMSWAHLIALPQTWGLILARAIMDPVWFFVTDWLAILLVSKGIPLEGSLIAFWVPFLAADLGNFSGGGLSSWLVHRGWSIASARKLPMAVFAVGLLSLVFVPQASSVLMITLWLAIATFSYAAWATIILVLPSDLFPSHSVATASGISGTGGGLGTAAATYLIGRVSDTYSFSPLLIAAGIMPLIATTACFAFISNKALNGTRDQLNVLGGE